MPNPVGLDAAGAPRENRHRSHAPQCDADSGFFSVHAPHIHVVVKMLSRTLDPDLLSQSCGCDAVCWVIVLVAQLVLRRT